MKIRKLRNAGNTAYTVTPDSQTMTYYKTDIVKHWPELRKISLDTGGFFTYTTKARMNSAFDSWSIPLHVYQEDMFWYCKNMQTGAVYPFNGPLLTVTY